MENSSTGSERRATGSRQVSRRTIVKGAAWSLPVLGAAVAVPTAAATVDPCQETVSKQISVLPSSSTNLTAGFERVTSSFVVPAGVTQLSYEIAGGGGGVNLNATVTSVSQPGGDGDLITGELAVVEGMVLELIVGNGGIGPTWNGGSLPQNLLIKGGGGFGDGGDLRTGTSDYVYAAGTGGGGSAILLGGQPLVVAGGGGGGGGGTPDGSWVSTLDSRGGDGGLVGGTSTSVAGHPANDPRAVYSATGGQGASGAVPGAGGGYAPSWSGTGASGVGVIAGLSGGSFAAGVGGRGADGVLSYPLSLPNTTGRTSTYTSGAGGGGYAGGASGNTTGMVYDYPPNGVACALGGGGGGGSSFVSPSSVSGATVLSATHSSAGNGVQGPLQRNPGWIVLRYRTC